MITHRLPKSILNGNLRGSHEILLNGASRIYTIQIYWWIIFDSSLPISRRFP